MAFCCAPRSSNIERVSPTSQMIMWVLFYINSHTSISSPSSQINVGPGNCPFILIIALGCPFGAPTSHARVNSCFMCLAPTFVARRSENKARDAGKNFIFADKRRVYMDEGQALQRLSIATSRNKVMYLVRSTERYLSRRGNSKLLTARLPTTFWATDQSQLNPVIGFPRVPTVPTEDP